MRVIFLVIASEDPIHQEDLATQKQTWASRLSTDYRVIWLRGSDGCDFVLDGDTLYVPCLESYSNILEKTILGIRFVLETLDFDILIRTNVSTYFDLPRLHGELSKNLYKKPFVGGYLDKSMGGYFGKSVALTYISGTGIFMSRGVAQVLSLLDSSDYLAIPDDVAISEFLSRRGILLIRMHRNNLGSTHLFLPSYFTRAKSSTDSTLASKRMRLLFRYFSTVGIIARCKIVLRIFQLEFEAFMSHPEGPKQYIQRNKVVFLSYILTKGQRLWLKITQY
jgi:hypothetical protein